MYNAKMFQQVLALCSNDRFTCSACVQLFRGGSIFQTEKNVIDFFFWGTILVEIHLHDVVMVDGF
jgi:hypothetical protein